MKRLLVYNQFEDAVLQSDILRKPDLQVEVVNSISDLLRKSLFAKTNGQREIGYDLFMVYTSSAPYAVAEFLHYLYRYKPELPLIILSPSAEQVNMLQILLKGIPCQISGPRPMEEIKGLIHERASKSQIGLPVYSL